MIKHSDSAHPSKLLDPAWITILRNDADKATTTGRLTDRQLQLFYEQNWFKALVPKVYGGLEWSLMEVVCFEEAIGWTEGSAGWVFTLCSGAGWFGGYLDPQLAGRIFKPLNACLAGSGAVGGKGSIDKDGQAVITGEWQYATGAPHATIFTANVYLQSQQHVRAFLFLPEEVIIKKTWNPIGLIASASESFAVSDLTIGSERAFDIDPDKPVIGESLYRMPFGPLAEATIAANLSGMTLHFMEEVELLWKQKKANRPKGAPIPDWTADAWRLLDNYYDRWFEVRERLWNAVKELESFVKNHMSVVRLADNKTYLQKSRAVSTHAQAQAALCREIVGTLYPYTGLTGASINSAIGKVWRDFQTGSQHALFVPRPKSHTKKESA